MSLDHNAALLATASLEQLESAVAAARYDLALRSGDDPAAFLDFDLVFDPTLRDGPFAEAFADALRSIRAVGARSAIDVALARHCDPSAPTP